MKISEMQALILAGGMGTRLQSVVADVPKPMAPLGDRPFLEYQIRYLKDQGIRRVMLLVGYKAETIEKHFGNGADFGIEISYCFEKELLGTAGALKNAESMIWGEHFLLLNGDTFFSCDLQILADYHLSTNSDATLALKIKPDCSRYGRVVLGESGRIERFEEKSPSGGEGYINAGIYVLNRSVLKKIPPGQKKSLETDYFPGMSASGLPMPDHFIDIGVPEDYHRAISAIPAWEKIEKKKALFLDRDGIINKDEGYVHLPEQLEYMPGIFDLCKAMQDHGYLLMVVTNQAGVAKGKYPERDIPLLHKRIREEFASRGITITDFAYCVYHQDATVDQFRKASLYRKPQPGMVLDMAEKWDVDIKKSFMLGDKKSDRIRLPYLRSIIVKSKYTPDGWDCEDLAAALSFMKEP